MALSRPYRWKWTFFDRVGYKPRSGQKLLHWAADFYRYIGFFQFMYNKLKNLINKKVKKENKEINLENRNWRLKGNPIESKIIGIDWKKTIATNHDFWGIKLIRENLDRDYEEVRKEIMEKMRQLKDKNEEKIIKNVWKREEIFNGEDLQKFPDIIYLPISKFEPTGFLPFSMTKNKAIPPRIRTSLGGHVTSREGIFLAVGPNINNIGNIGEINILDIAPTVLHMFQVSVPEDMDGRVLKEIIHDQSTYC